jgi:hypothetical protein
LPYIKLNENNSSAGSFSGQMNLRSPNGAFSGRGSLQGLPETVNQVLAVYESVVITGAGVTREENRGVDAISINITNRASSLSTTPISFDFRGVRTSTSVMNQGN